MSGIRDYLGKKPSLADRVEEDRVKSTTDSTKSSTLANEQIQPSGPVLQDVAQPKGTDNSIEAIQTLANKPQTPAISERVSSGENIYDILLSMGKPVDYEAEEKKLKRERNTALIGDLAGVVGDSLGLALGARQFYPRQSNAARVDGKIERLSDFKRADSINHWNKGLSAKYKDYEIERAQRAQDAKAIYQKSKDDIANGVWGAEMKLKIEKLNRDLANDKISQDQWNKEFSETVKQHSITNSQGERRISIADKNAETSKASKDAKLKGDNRSMDSITVKDSEGKPKRVDYPKHMNAALTSYLYGRMKDITGKGDPKKRTIEDIEMQFGESGDQASKMSAIVKRRISEFPELIPEMERVIQNNSTGTSSASLLPRSGSGSLLPK